MTIAELPASLIRTLPGSAYTDPLVFAREQERIFERLWFCAARADELAGAGAYRTVQVGRESVLIARSDDGDGDGADTGNSAATDTGTGTVRAFLNSCRHRGSVLCDQETGRVKRTFRCAYHAWTYGLDGKLVAAPNLARMPDIDRTEYGLVPVHAREWLGYVWVCLADTPPDFEEHVVGAATARLGDPAAIERYRTETLGVGRRVDYDVRANWKLIVENFMECYHCATIHPELVHVLPEFAGGYAAQYYVGHGAQFGDGVEGFTVDGGPGVDRIPGVAPDQDRRYYAITIKPQVFVNLVPDHVVVLRMIPLAADRTRVVCDWLFLPEVLDGGRDIDRSVELFHRVNTQDFEACERTQPGMASRAYAGGGVLVPSEHHIAQFHAWVAEQLRD